MHEYKEIIQKKTALSSITEMGISGRKEAGITAELDAINLYEQMAALTENENIRKILLDIAKEEKTHVGEFQALLLKEDKEQMNELEHGKEEVEEITGI